MKRSFSSIQRENNKVLLFFTIVLNTENTEGQFFFSLTSLNPSKSSLSNIKS